MRNYGYSLIPTSIFPHCCLGLPLQAVQLASGHCERVSFLYVADEICAVLTSKKFGWTEDKARQAAEMLLTNTVFVEPDNVIAVVRDAKDDPILACAVAAQVDFLVTGDNDLLSLKAYDKVRIITPRAFIDRVENW